MSFNNNIPDWASNQFSKTTKSDFENRFNDTKKSETKDSDGNSHEASRKASYIEQLAHMNPEFRRTVEPKQMPKNLIGKPALMKAHMEGTYDNGAVGSIAHKGRSEFSVYSQFDKLGDKVNSSSAADALAYVGGKDKVDSDEVKAGRVKREVTQRRAIDKLVRTEGFLDKAQAKGKETFERPESDFDFHDFRQERKNIQKSLGKREVKKDEFTVSSSKPAGHSIVDSLRDKLKNKGLI